MTLHSQTLRILMAAEDHATPDMRPVALKSAACRLRIDQWSRPRWLLVDLSAPGGNGERFLTRLPRCLAMSDSGEITSSAAANGAHRVATRVRKMLSSVRKQAGTRLFTRAARKVRSIQNNLRSRDREGVVENSDFQHPVGSGSLPARLTATAAPL